MRNPWSLSPRADGVSYTNQIVLVSDHPERDKRYRIDASRIYNELGWTPAEMFDTGIEKPSLDIWPVQISGAR